MVHSVELVFDQDIETTIRDVWDQLRDAGIAGQASAGRPHTTLTVAERIDAEVDDLLAPLTAGLPTPVRIGAPLFFGRAKAVLARLVVPTAALLDLHAEVHRLCLPHLHPGPMATALPGRWTAHVTLARRVTPAQMGRAVRIAGTPAEIEGVVVGLRRWDGATKREYPIG
ncbi:2'-5' RNA ligase family protein [Mycolicibacterium sp. XJ1819]